MVAKQEAFDGHAGWRRRGGLEVSDLDVRDAWCDAVWNILNIEKNVVWLDV